MLKLTDSVKGHDFVQNQLCQALKKDRLAHALLFSGPEGIGKKKLALALAKSLLCLDRPSLDHHSLDHSSLDRPNKKSSSFQACGRCLSCRSLSKGESADMLEIKTDTLQIKLDDLKAIPAFLSLQSFAKAKIVFIPSAEKLNPQASNFLLKSIEEPSSKVFFFLITSQREQISLTLLSRLQNITFQSLSEDLIKELSPPETKAWMIKSSRGQMNLLEDLKDQKELRDDSFSHLFESIQKELEDLDFLKDLKCRQTALKLLNFWRLFLRDLRLLSFSTQLINEDQRERMKLIKVSSKRDLDFLIQKTLQTESHLKSNADIKLSFESFIMSLKNTLTIS